MASSSPAISRLTYRMACISRSSFVSWPLTPQAPVCSSMSRYSRILVGSTTQFQLGRLLRGSANFRNLLTSVAIWLASRVDFFLPSKPCRKARKGPTSGWSRGNRAKDLVSVSSTVSSHRAGFLVPSFAALVKRDTIEGVSFGRGGGDFFRLSTFAVFAMRHRSAYGM